MTLEKADIDTHHIIGDRFKSENKCVALAFSLVCTTLNCTLNMQKTTCPRCYHSLGSTGQKCSRMNTRTLHSLYDLAFILFT